MSAGETLYISYTGQDDRDNCDLPPSVVVSELLDYVRRAFVREGAPGLPPAIVTRHRLQSFSSDYYSGEEDSGLFSYSPGNRDALEAGRLSGQPQRAFIRAALPEDHQLTGALELHQLCGFLGNPARSFLTRRLKVSPHDPADEIEEREPFALDSLSRYYLRQELTGRLLNDETCDSLYESIRARGTLPPLAAGRIAFQAALEECGEFAALVSPQLGQTLEPLPFSIGLHGVQLSGLLKDLRQGLNLRWRCADMKARDRLTLWCEHLVLNALAADGYPRRSRLVCRDLTLELPPLDNARELLADLLELHRLGMCRPLHFFPQTSWLYLAKGMPAAEGRWYGSDHSPSPAESSEASFAFCFCGLQVLDEEFTCLAHRVYDPLRTIANETKNT
jgi:exodeoxyribonuclease V gamma subunit